MESETQMLDTKRIQHLADNIRKDFDLLKEYEDKLRLEDDPRRRAKYQMEIEQLRKSAESFEREYNKLQTHIGTKSSMPMQNVGAQLQQMETKLDTLQTGQKAILDNLVYLRQTVLARFDVNEQKIINTIIDRLDPEKLIDIQAVLDGIATSHLPDYELQKTLDAVRETLNEIRQQKTFLSDSTLASDLEQLSDVVDAPKLDVSHKLKITVPIIPFFLSYEGFVELKSGMNLESAWKKLLDRVRGKQRKRVHEATSFEIISTYLQKEREDVFGTIAPGSIKLLIGDIIGSDKLFISPPWANYLGSVRSEELIEYLVSFLYSGKSILLLGQPGQGKTTILKRVFTIMVDRFLQKYNDIIPIYIPLREIAYSADRANGTLLWVWQHLHKKSSNQLPLTYDQFTSLLQKKRIVFLYDGLDEMAMELSQRSINECVNSEVFNLPSILSCRKNFYELNLSESVIKQRFLEKVDLLPLKFTESVKEYIVAFCDNKRVNQEKVSKKIIQTIQHSKELLDLAQRPLLLTMILDIFSDSQKMLEIEWSLAKLYESYTEKWLNSEAVKPDSVLKWEQKAELLEKIGWLIYQKSVPSSYAYGDNQTVKFTKTELSDLLGPELSGLPGSYDLRFQQITRVQIIDDICLRSFLIGSYGGHYYFIHKSFQEYYVAKYIIKSMQQSVENIARALVVSTPAEVAAFLEVMLKEKAMHKHESDLIADNLIKVYQQNGGNDYSSLIIREHSCYYLACLGTQKATQFLENSYVKETNKWVQRGMMVGLSIFCNREDIIEKYIGMLYIDSEAASINIGYNLAYCGDQSLEEGYYDKGESKVSGMVRELFRHLGSEKYKAGWALDLLTLRTLLQDKRRGISILHANNEYIPFLRGFLSNHHRERGRVFHKERQLLQDFLAVGSVLGD